MLCSLAYLSCPLTRFAIVMNSIFVNTDTESTHVPSI